MSFTRNIIEDIQSLSFGRGFFDFRRTTTTFSYFARIFKIQIVKKIKAAGAFFARNENYFDFQYFNILINKVVKTK